MRLGEGVHMVQSMAHRLCQYRSASVFSSSNEDFRITESVAILEGCEVRIAPL